MARRHSNISPDDDYSPPVEMKTWKVTYRQGGKEYVAKVKAKYRSDAIHAVSSKKPGSNFRAVEA